MADFSTKLSDPNTKFTQVQARQRPDTRGSQISTAIQGAALAGGAFAKASGSKVAGGNLTQAEVNTQADIAETELDNQITDAMVAGGGTLTGSLQEQERTQMEIKDSALTEFAQNDRVLKELRDRGVISTLEARGRRQLNLQRALSNPINALFKGEFLNASQSLTGGAKGPVGEVFPFTPEELRSQAVLREQVNAEAEFAGKKASIMAATGRSDAFVSNELAAQAEAEIQMKQLERTKQQRALNGEEFSRQHSISQSMATRGVMLDVYKKDAANGGNGLTANDLIKSQRTIEQTYQGMLEAINTDQTASSTFNIGKAERDKAREELDNWKKGMEAALKPFDSATLDTAQLEETKRLQEKIGLELFPMFSFLNTMNPKFIETVMLQGGNLQDLDRFTRPGFTENLSTAVDRLKAVTDFSLNKPPANIDVAGLMIETITDQGSDAGIDYVISPEVQEDKSKKINLAKIYNATPDVALQAYNTSAAQRKAPKEFLFRREIDAAMKAGLSKMNQIKQMIGAQDEVIFAEPEAVNNGQVFVGKGLGFQPTANPNKNPNWILNLPDGMQENSRDLKSMHNMVVKQPWMWNHVKDNYVNGSDAFNGFMRGEWDVNVELLDQQPTDTGTSEGGKDLGAAPQISGNDAPIVIDRSPIQGDVPGGRQRSTGAPITIDRGPLQGDVPAKGESVLEGTTGAPTAFPTVESGFDEQFLREFLSDPSDAVVQSRVQDFENASKTGFDGSVWKPHKSLEGGTDTLAYGHKLTDKEEKANSVKIGGKSVDLDKGITEKQAQQLFKQDWEVARKGSSRIVKDNHLGALPQKAKSILQEMVFQMGEEGVRKFKTTIRLLAKGDFDKAADGMLNSKWAKKDSPARANILAEEIRSLGDKATIDSLKAEVEQLRENGKDQFVFNPTTGEFE